MSKKVAFLLFLLAVVIVGGYWALRHFSPTNQPPVSLPTKPPLPQVLPQKTSELDAKVSRWQARLKANPDDLQAYSQLARAYLQKAREVGDPTYYTKTDDLLQTALELDSNSFEAVLLMGMVCLAQHRFGDALDWGQRAKAVEPSSPYVYGVLTDAYVDLGNYPKAIESLQQMVNLRPDLSSYSRVAHLRALTGDVEGAIEAMNMAINAGRVGTEARTWCQTRLGHLYFNSGKLHLADSEYHKALTALPNYVHAIAGRAKVFAARGDYAKSILLYKKIVEVMPNPEYVIALGDVYHASGDATNAEQQYALVQVISQLYQANGVDTDLELALFDADHNRNLPEAVRRARKAFDARQSIHAADVLAWTLYKADEYEEAYQAARQALRLGTKDALLHFHAGMICKALGKTDEARSHLEQALGINPYFSLLYADEATRTWQALCEK